MKTIKLLFVLGLLFIPKQWINAQCDPNQKYDKIISGYHSSIALKEDGGYSVWGALMSSTGTADVLSPQDINSTNYPALTGTVLRAALGGSTAGAAVDQAIVLTTNGLWAWGVAGNVLSTGVKSGTAIGRTSTTAANGFNTYGLPSTITPTDVQSIFASYRTLVLVTKIVGGTGGDVWVLTQTSLALEGNGGAVATAGTSQWKRVKTNGSTYLTGVTDCRGQVSSITYNALMAITSSGLVYTWGNSSYLGNAAASAARNYATLMTLPTEFASEVPKMIGVTGGISTTNTTKNTYYLLSNAGNLYALGHNSQRQCGDFTTTERTSWVQVQKSATAGDYFTGVTFFSCQEGNSSYPGLALVSSTADLYTFGNNSSGMIGRTDNGLINGAMTTVSFNPGIAVGFVGNAVYVEMGGHTMVYFIEGTTQFCYVGHQIQGSMGDGTTLGAGTISTATLIHNCVDTPYVTLCGYVPTVPNATHSLIASSPSSISANGVATSTLTVSLRDISNVAFTTSGGTVAMSTTAGTLSSVTDNNDGTYTAILTSSTSLTTATISFTINGTAGTNTATVAFVLPVPSTSYSTIAASPPNILSNGTATSTVTVTLRDANNVALTSSGGTVVVNTTSGTIGTVTNNNNGTYTATLTSPSSTTTSTATLSFTVNGSACTATTSVVFVAPASTTNSLIASSPTSIVANSLSTSTITVTLKDASNTALTISGGTVAMATTAGTLGSVTNNNNGTYTAILTSSATITTATLSFTVNGIAASHTATVSFVAPAVVNNSTIVASPTSTISTSTITVTLKNASNTALTISGGTVTMATNLGTLSAVTDNNNGTYTAVLTSSNPAANSTATVTFKVNGSANSTNTATVTFLANASTATSTITPSPASIAANGITTSTITVQLKTAAGANFVTGGNTVTMTTTAGTLSAVTNPGNNGTFTATLTSSQVVSTALLSFKLNGVTCTNTASVTFTAPVAAINNSLISASPSTLTANGTSTSTITVTLRDGSNIPLISSGGTVTMTTSSGSLLPVTDNNNGTYTATYISSTTVTTAVVSFKIGASANSSNTASIVLTAPIPSISNSTIAASPTTILANGTATSTITVSLRDASNVAMVVSGGTVTMSTSAGTIGAVTNNNNGTYTATLTSSSSATDITATVSFTIAGNAASNTASVNFVAPASTTYSTITALPATILATGATTSTVLVTLRNASDVALGISGGTVTMATTAGTLGAVTNNNNGTYTATLTSSNSATNVSATISFAINGSAATNTDTVDFLSAANLTNSIISASPTSILANGTSTSTITVTLKNAAGIPLTISGGTVTMARTGTGTLSAVTNNNNGTYSAILTSAAAVGTGTITFKINGSANSVNTQVVNYIALPTAANSLISASPSTIVADGLSTSDITVTLRNASNVVVPVSGGTVAFTTTAGTISAVNDNGDGTYSGTLTSNTSITTATVGFNLNGTTGTNTTTVGFVAPPSTTNSLIAASPKRILNDGIATSTITVTLKNASNVALNISGGTVEINSDKGTVGGVTDNNNGTYTASLTSSTTVETANLSFKINGNACSHTETVDFVHPTITATGTLTSFTSCEGTESSEESVTVSGSTLVGNITIAAPSGYEVSNTSGASYGNTLTLTPDGSGNVASTTTYVRLKNNAINGDHGNVHCSAEGADSRDFDTGTATVNTLPTITSTTPGSRCNAGTVTLGATVSSGTINWYATSTGGSPIGTGTSFTTPSISTTTTYYVSGLSSSCNSATRTAVVATVYPVSAVGTITGTATVCSGTNSTVLTLGSNTGTIQWQSATSLGGTYSNIGGATGTTYTAINLTATTYYQAVVTSGVCSAATSAVFTLTVSPITVAGTVASAQTICTGSAPADFILSGNTGTITNWQRATNVGFTTGLATIANTSTTLTGATIGTLSANTYFRATIQSGACAVVTSTPVLVTISTATVAGTITGAATVCTGTNSTVLTLTGSTGARQWQSATSIAGTYTNITGATATTYTATNLSATTYYRVVLTNGACTSTTTPFTLTVSPTTVAGTVTGATTVCTGTNSTVLTLGGNTGTVQWQSASALAGPYTNIPGATATTYTATNLTATTYGQVVVTSGVCASATTPRITMTVNPASSTTGMTVTAAETICSGATPATNIVLAGTTPVGSVIKWQKASDATFTTSLTDIANTTTTLTAASIGALTATTYFRAVIQSGVCAVAYSPTASKIVNVVNTGLVTGTTSLCTGTGTTLTISGYTAGAALQWQSATTLGGTYGAASGTNTSAAYTTGNLTAATSNNFQVRVTVTLNAVACIANYPAFAVTVSPASVGGTVAGSTTVCTGTNSTTLTLSGHTGAITRWESSLDNFATAGTSIANTTTTLTATNLTATTYYRAVLTSGACSSANSATATVTVSPVSVGGSVAGSATVCTGTNSTTLTLSGHTGSITRWESSLDDFATAGTSIAITTTTLTATNLTATTYYRAVLTSGACAAAYSAKATVTASPVVTITLGTNPTITQGTTSANLPYTANNAAQVYVTFNTAAVAAGYTGSQSASLSGASGNIILQVPYCPTSGAGTYSGTLYVGNFSPACTSTTYPFSVTITSSPAPTGTASQSFCTGATVANLAATGTGILWYGVSSGGSPLASSTVLVNGNHYYASQNPAGCESTARFDVTATVSPTSVGGSVAGSATVCTGTNSTTLTLSGHTGSITRWESSLDNFATAGTSIANTTTTLTATNLTATTYYRAVLTSNPCSSANSVSATVTVSPASVGGTVAGSATVCTGTNSTTLTLSGHTGSITRWESSLDNFATAGTSIANTTTTLIATNLTATTYYRAVPTSGACASANSATATVTVSPISVGGTIAGSATVCIGTNSTTLTLSGHTGSITKWQSATASDFSGTVTDIANTITTLTATNLATTTFYRAVLTSSPCSSANSITAAVIVSPASVGGTVAGSATVCTGINSTTLTLSGHTGSITRWESSLDNFATAGTGIANTTTTLTATNLTATTYYRAVLTSGACSSANSATATVTVSPASVGGTVAGSAIVCTGTNSTTLTLSGHTGSITRWESSLDNFATAGTSIANTTTTLTATNLTATTYYRAVLTSGACSANSATASITVSLASVGGTVAGSATVCTGTNSATLTLSGHTGAITRWESSIDNFATAGTSIANTTTTLTATNLTATTYYRAVLTSGACAGANSATATVTVSSASVGGTVAGSATVCTGTNSTTLTLSGHTGTITRWESSLDNFATAGTFIANTTTTLAATNLTATTYYRAVLTSGVCTSANSAIATVTVSVASVGGTTSSTAETICSGSTPANNITLAGKTGNVIKWQSALDVAFTTSLTDIANTTTTLSAASIGTLNATTYFRAVVQNGSCATVNSSSVTKTVTTIATGTISYNAGSASVCNGTTVTLRHSLNTAGSTRVWQSSTDGINFTNISGATARNYTVPNTTGTIYYRVNYTTGGCTLPTPSLPVTKSPASVAGTITGVATVCTGTNSTIITLGSNVGTVQWQSATASGGTYTNIVGETNQTYTATNLTATTYYKAVVTSGACTSATTTFATMTVSPASVGGSVAGSATVCTGTNSTTLTLSGHTGSITRWESSLDNFATAGTIIANTTTTLTATNLTATTYYRAVLTSGACADANSATATVTVSSASVGGTVAGSATVCTGTNSTTLTLSGHTGSITRWESSLDNFATAGTSIANTTTTLTATNLTATTYYRAVLTSSPCSAVNSATASITVSPTSVGGTVSSNQTLCTVSAPALLSLSGYTGSVVKWQKSATADFASPTDIPNTFAILNGATIGVISTTTYFRAVVQSGICSTTNSNYVTIDINLTYGGTVSGTASICSGTQATDLTLSGYSGTIVKWQKSVTSDFASPTDIASTSATLAGTTIGNISATTYFRAVILHGSCGNIYSSIASMNITTTTWNGTSWDNGVPNATTRTIMTGNYTSPANGATDNLYMCNLTVTNGAIVDVLYGDNFIVTNEVTVDTGASLTFESNANLVQINNVADSGNIIVKRDTNLQKRMDYVLWSTPVMDQNLKAFSPLTFVSETVSRFYNYNSLTNQYQYIFTPEAYTFATGKGYLIRMPNTFSDTVAATFNSQFTGVPNNGDITVSVVQSGATDGGTHTTYDNAGVPTYNVPNVSTGYNAIGNPYPSTLDLDNFFIANGIAEALYFWRKTNNTTTSSYATYTMAGGVRNTEFALLSPGQVFDYNQITPSGVLQAGQGFIFKAVGPTVTFTNSMRFTNNANQFFRNASVEKNRIWLNLSSETATYNQTMVSYMTGATNGVDAAIDGKYINDCQTALTSYLNNTEYVIQGKGLPFVATDIVPLAFKNTVPGNYTIALDHFDGLFSGSQDIYLKDNVANITHDLKQSAYTFASTAGVFNSRFELVYSSSPLATQNPAFNDNSIVVYKQNEVLNVNTGSVNMKGIKIFDVRGRLLYEKSGIGATSLVIKDLTSEQQVLIVQITSEDDKMVAKKIVF